MSPSLINNSSRYLFVYRPTGFPDKGGIYRLASDIYNRLASHERLTLVCADVGLSLGGGPICTQPAQGDVLLIFGCASPWAYITILRARLAINRLPVIWLPSFHDPLCVRHRTRALIAGLVIRAFQHLGVRVFVQTRREQSLLQGPQCFLSSHGFHQELRTSLLTSTRQVKRDIDLIFLGRPTVQKGWDRFLQLVNQSHLHCAAIVPDDPVHFTPYLTVPDSLQVVVAPSDASVRSFLQRSKLAIIPSDYESLGIAQLEAVAAGCVVPILGDWPFWEDYIHLHFQSLPTSTLAYYCHRICSDPNERFALARSQRHYVLTHPAMAYPWLPGVIA